MTGEVTDVIHRLGVHICCPLHDDVGMAYDEELASRMREQLIGQPGLTEKRMFGGLAFLIDGNMAASASSQGGMLLRVDPADTASLVTAPDAQRFRMRGREMDGWLAIKPAGLSTDDALIRWLSHGIAYARRLPPKTPKK